MRYQMLRESGNALWLGVLSALMVCSAGGADIAFALKTCREIGQDVLNVTADEMMRFEAVSNRLVWTGHPVLGAGFTVIATAETNDVGTTWTFAYEGNTSDRFIEEVVFPQWTVRRSERARTLLPIQSGLVRRPDWAKLSSGDVAGWAGPRFMGFHFAAVLEQEGDSHYIDQRGEARFHATRFAVRQGSTPGACVLESIYEMPQTDETRRAFRLPFPCMTATFRGDWFAATAIYRNWVREQPWFRRAATRDFGKLRDIALWAWNRGKSEVVVPPVLQFMKDTGLKAALDWYWWHEIPYDTCYPFFWPPREPLEAFKNGIRSVQSAGGYVQPYTNGMLWDCDDARWREGGDASAIVNRSGEVKATAFNPYTKQRQAWMCGEATPFQSKMRELVRTIRETGMDGVYMDMIANAAYGSCFNPRHGHPRGGGRHMVDGYRAYVASIRAGNPGLTLMSEEPSEAYLDLFDGLIYVYPSYERFGMGVAPEVEMVPVASAILHGAVVGFGSFATIDNLPPWDEKWGPSPWTDSSDERLDERFPDQFAVEFSRGVVWGLQPTVHKFLLEHATSSRFAAAYAFVKDTARFYYDHRDFLFDGEMCAPGRMVCATQPVVFLRRSCYTKPRDVSTVEEPALPTMFHSVWRTKDGRLAAIIVNWSRKAQPYRLVTPDLSASGILPPRSWKLVEKDPEMPRYALDFGARDGVAFNNHADLTATTGGVFRGKPALRFFRTDKPGKDTAWGLTTPQFAVTPSNEFAVVLEAGGALPKGGYILPGAKVRWYGPGGAPLEIVDQLGRKVPHTDGLPFPTRTADSGLARVCGKGIVPDEAVAAELTFAVDFPNLLSGEEVYLTELAYFEHPRGKAWAFDEISSPRLTMLTKSPGADPCAPIRFRLDAPSGIDADSVVCSLNGRELVHGEMAIAADGTYAVPPQGGMWPTNALVEIEVDAANRKGFRSHEYGFVSFDAGTSAHPTYAIRDDGMMLRDGEPIFPIGVCSVRPCDANGMDVMRGVRELAENGVNLAHTYMLHDRRQSDYETLAAACAREGVMLYSEPGPRPNENDTMRDAKILAALRFGCTAHGVAAWGVGDDTTHLQPPGSVARTHRMVKSVDPNALTISFDVAHTRYQQLEYVPYADILMLEIYPFKAIEPEAGEMAHVAFVMDNGWAATRAAGIPNRSVMAGPQAFKGWKTWKRYPTKEELLAETFISIACRARGFCYYTSFAVNGNEGPLNDPVHKREFFEVTRQISALAPSLVKRDAARQPTVRVLKGPAKNVLGDDSIRVLLKEDGLLVAANASDETVTAVVEMPDGAAIEHTFEKYGYLVSHSGEW